MLPLPATAMTPPANSTLASLEQGFQQLKARHQPCACNLRGKLKRGEAISLEEENWLDGPANLTDEELVLDILRSSSPGNFDAVVASLSEA